MPDFTFSDQVFRNTGNAGRYVESGWRYDFKVRAPKREVAPEPGKSALQTAAEVLGLRGAFTYEQARAAYRQRVKLAHPDLGGSSAEVMRVIEAWRVVRRVGGE